MSIILTVALALAGAVAGWLDCTNKAEKSYLRRINWKGWLILALIASLTISLGIASSREKAKKTALLSELSVNQLKIQNIESKKASVRKFRKGAEKHIQEINWIVEKLTTNLKTIKELDGSAFSRGTARRLFETFSDLADELLKWSYVSESNYRFEIDHTNQYMIPRSVSHSIPDQIGLAEQEAKAIIKLCDQDSASTEELFNKISEFKKNIPWIMFDLHTTETELHIYHLDQEAKIWDENETGSNVN